MRGVILFFAACALIMVCALYACYTHAQVITGPGVANSVTVTSGAYTVNSVNTLRSTDLTNSGSVILQGWYAGSSLGGGNLVYVSSDTTSSDNGCTIFIDSANHRFYRQIPATGLSVADCGAKGDGTTNDTAAIQATINLACASGNASTFPVTIPPTFVLGINAALNFKGCYGLVFGGQVEVSYDVFKPTIKWIGTAGAGPMLSVNQTDSMVLHGLMIDDTTNTQDVVIDDTESGTVTTTNTYNDFNDLFIRGPASPDANFVAIRIGFNNTTGNTDVGRFDKVNILCSNASPASATTNGTGFLFVNSSAEPFVDSITRSVIMKCSKGIDTEGQVSLLRIDTGAYTSNYYDFYANTGSNIEYRNIRSETPVNGIYIGPLKDISIVNDEWGGTTGTDIIVVGQASFITIDHVIFAAPTNLDVSNSNGGNRLFITQSKFSSGQCPSFADGQGQIISYDNVASAGCPMTSFNITPTVASFVVAKLPSAPDVFAGEIAIVTNANAPCSAGATPTGGGSTKCFVGYNGTAWLEFGI